jgi:type I restriction enzyme, S subunit
MQTTKRRSEMSDKITKSPQIRFAGFTDAWELRKLGEISEKVTEKNKENKYSETLTNSAEYGIVSQRDFFDKDISNEKNLNGYYVVREDNFVYNPRISNFAPVGPIKRNKLGRTGVMSPLYYVLRTHNIDKTFLEYYFDATGWHTFMKLNGDSGARADRFAIKDSIFSKMPIPYPTLEEQRRIGNLLDLISNHITLHQRKFELLKETKKILLQKMFPKDGANVPEIRFEGFTDAWEQRKLGDVAESFEYGLNAAATEFDGENKYLRITDIDDETHEFKTDSLTSPNVDIAKVDNYRLQEGDVLFARTGASVGKTYRYKESDGLVYFAGFLIRARIKPEYDTEFVFHNTLTDRYNRFITITSQRSGQPGVNAQEYADFIISTPKFDEQRKIGLFFDGLDHLITLHQRELNSLEKLKKSLLQQMII